jgi:ribose-phosphate pyrophosphokinase
LKITTLSGDVPFRLFKFPDGQRHFQLLLERIPETAVTIESPIRSADELFDVLIAKDTLDARGHITSLDIRYLLAARMDRRIDQDQPFTLQIVCRTIAAAGFRRIHVLDPHSPVSLSLLNAQAVMPMKTVGRILDLYHPDELVVLSPDAGATDRVKTLLTGHALHLRQGKKHRDSKTGALSGFTVDDLSFFKGKRALIIDDICDGGGTFTAHANMLIEAGAISVDLYVTHGIFSQGTPLAGIRRIYTTDSFADSNSSSTNFVVMPVSMHDDSV